jgi:membrane-associated phospholipid phosphatase
LTKIIKIFVGAERPFSYFKIETLESHNNIFASFPSGHSTLAFALATSV